MHARFIQNLWNKAKVFLMGSLYGFSIVIVYNVALMEGKICNAYKFFIIA